MNHSDDRIPKGLRDLAARAPQGAPPEIGLKLKSAFRQHQVRRRRIRAVVGVAALAACVAIAAIISLKATAFRHQTTPTVAGTIKPILSNPSTQSTVAPLTGGVAVDNRPPKHPTVRKVAKSDNTIGNIAKGFTPLPSYDPAVPATGYQIVRVGLQDTALSQLGVAVRESDTGQRVVTDLLVDRDGMPMAYRFVGGVKTR